MFFSGFGTDDENELPGSSDWFKLDGEVGLGRANKRADLVKVESLLANSGDLDLSDIGGPTGYGLYTVEDGVKKYQSRNGLDVDGWMKPGGPTISKMKEQLGGLLSGYPAPTPEQVDQHHRLRAEGKDGLLNVDLPPISLKGNPTLPPVDKTTHGSNESWVNWMTRHQKGLGGAPDMLATYIKNFGTDGIVQARDFVEQWEKAVPGEGATAIRAVLSRLSDPAQQRAFLGGNLPKGTPFGVLKSDPAEMIDHVMAPERSARDSADDEKPRWVYDPETGNAGWVVPKKLESLSSNESTDQAQAEKTGRDADEIDNDRLAPFLDRREPQVEAGVQVAQNSDTMTDASPTDAESMPQQVAQAQAAEAQRREVLAREYEKLKQDAQSDKKWFGESKECVALVKHVTGLGPTSNWRAGDKVTPENAGALKPGTAIATFEKDPKSNGELRYLSRPSGNHAGIVDSVGEKNGRQGLFVLDQYRGQVDRNGRQAGEAGVRFYPFDRAPGERGYRAGDFYIIQGRASNAK